MTGNRSRFSLVMTIVAVVVAVLLSTFNTPTVTTAQGATGVRPVASNPTDTGGDGKGGSVPAGLVLLYNQTGTQDLDVTSQDFEAAFDAFDNQAADDFVVPAGQTWLVDSVFAAGAYSATPSGQTWDVFFYSNSGSLPGTLVGSALGATATTDVAGDVTIPVSPAVSLPPGTYWVSVQINMAFNPGGQWFWGELNGITNNDFAWQNPGGGFGANCPTWNRNCAFLQAQDDLIFQIYGTIAGGATPTPTATATNTPVGPTSTATATPTNTPVAPTNTATATATNTPVGPTNTPTATATPGSGNRFCSTTPITIPDANPTGATGTIVVGSAGTISDLNVIITGTHTWVGDIRLNLSNGTTNVTFYDQPGVPASTFGCSGDNLPGVIADDEGVNGSFENSCQNATPAYTPGGSYTNNNPLSAFDGAATNATWTLTASDLAAGDTGAITGWCVEFGGGAGPTPTATATPTTPAQVPDINLSPSSFNETHSSPPQTTTDTLNVQNVGAGTLTWTIAEDDSRPGTIMTAKGEYGFDGTVQAVSGFGTSGVAGETIINTPNVAQGSLFITHSSTQNITALNSVSCNAGGLHTDNSYYRVYDLVGDFGITQTIEVDEVSFGVEQAVGATGTQPVTVNLYTLTGVLNTANLTLIGSEAIDVPDSATGTVFSVPVAPEVTVPAGSVLVVELFTPNGQTAGNSFFIGSNADPETDPSYLRAPDCGVAQPTATGAIGFPNMHIVMNVSAGIVGGGACTAPTDIPWLTVSPNNGSTAGGGSTPVTLTYNSTSLAQGTYTGTLCVASNDPDEALVTVPITLNVGLPTAIDLSSFTSPVSGVNLADLAAAGLLLLASAVLVLRRK